jgi:hypothetical protein
MSLQFKTLVPRDDKPAHGSSECITRKLTETELAELYRKYGEPNTQPSFYDKNGNRISADVYAALIGRRRKV